jgi:hypothetical protein
MRPGLPARDQSARPRGAALKKRADRRAAAQDRTSQGKIQAGEMENMSRPLWRAAASTSLYKARAIA